MVGSGWNFQDYDFLQLYSVCGIIWEYRFCAILFKANVSLYGRNFDTIINVEDLDPEDLMVALDLELVSEETQEPIKIRLNRKANELSSRAFQRLELTLVKKLTPKNKNKNKKRRKEAPGTGSNRAPTAS